MDRRTFIQAFASALAMGTVSGAPVLGAGDGWKTEFAAALARHPALLGFKGTQTGFKTESLSVEGTVPEKLRGTLYRNGPARHEIGDMRYHHWFDGDGMVHAFRFDDAGVSHIGRFVDTAKSKAEKEAGHSLFPGFGTQLPGMLRAPSADGINTANINVIRYNGELLALWEGGSAHRLDPDTLETLGLKSWSDQTKGLPFGAHPRVDQDGTLWNIGYATTAGAIVIYRIDANGKLRDTGVIPMPNTAMVHDFMITERHLVLILPPYHFDGDERGSFLDHFKWKPELGGRALIIEKNDLTQIKEMELPPFWVFHFANAFEDSDGSIRFQAPIYETPEAMTSTFTDIMRGGDMPSAGSQFISGRLDIQKGAFEQETVQEAADSEFPRIDPRNMGLRHRHTVVVQGLGSKSGFETNHMIRRLDHATHTSTAFAYSSDESAEEHIYVPDPAHGSSDGGWILGTALNFKTGKTSLNVFDAAHLQEGPIARLYMDYAIPLGLHGNFVPA